MSTKSYHFVRWGVIAATIVVLALCGVAARFAFQFFDATAWVNHTSDVIGEIRAIRAEVGLPGQQERPGNAVPAQIADILDRIDRIASLVQDNPAQVRSIKEFRALIASIPSDGRRDEIDSATFESAYYTLDRMLQEEYRLLALRTHLQSDATRNAAIAISALCLVLLVLGLFTSLAAQREFRRRELAEATLMAEKQELTRFTSELALVAAGSELIQTAVDEHKVNEAVAQVMSELVQGSRGYFALISPSNDLVEVCSHWGDVRSPAPFGPNECIALQLGHQVHRAQSLVPVRCTHAGDDLGDYLCTPVRSATGHLGVLHLSCSQKMSHKTVDAVSLFAAQVGLGLTNMRMREALRNQTVRDSLTGLFNRRYFDETLQRELASARRENHPICVLMLDLDHFKNINDTFGHGAGDEALRTFGRLVRSSFRESDVACRYGGEEFALVLLGANSETAFAKAESFRTMVEKAEFGVPGSGLGTVTTSIGLACSDDFPVAKDLVQAADAALYRAKQMGRNMTFAETRDSGERTFSEPAGLA